MGTLTIGKIFERLHNNCCLKMTVKGIYSICPAFLIRHLVALYLIVHVFT